MGQAITFVVSGQAMDGEAATRGAVLAPPPTPTPAAELGGSVRRSVRLGAARGDGTALRIDATPGDDIVVLHIAGGPSLFLHPETARELMQAQGGTTRDGEVGVPHQLQWQGLAHAGAKATRSLGDVAAWAFDVVSGFSREPAADLVADGVVAHFDQHAPLGLFALDGEALPDQLIRGTPLAQAPARGDGKPLLVLVHGTFSDTVGTFRQLWGQHPQLARDLVRAYDGHAYGFNHATLGDSPIANALALARAMPEGAVLDLLTHSRGGLVAEVLARMCALQQVSPQDLALFAGDAYGPQREDLAALGRLVKERRLAVRRMVRVACPARGTLLASKKLDAYISVVKWGLELAGVPVAPELVAFLGEVARRRADPRQIPGLAAQIPDSPLVQWLHATPAPIDSDLRVVAGDIEGDSVTSWVKTLMADAFYWTDNDLIVQTRSMYGGAPRGSQQDGEHATDATFVLDQGGKVSHFNYFANELTARAVVDALRLDAPPGFQKIGPLSAAGQSSTGLRAASPPGEAPGARPAVFVLPGILGSNLKVGDERIWLGWRVLNGLGRLAYRPNDADGVKADGPIERVYEDLCVALQATHEVFRFGFDWRRPIEEEARRLGQAIGDALDARQASGQPVRLLAHSMGGLVARTFQLECPQVWARMMSHPDARVLMLGTPNGGSWAPMQLLSGDDTFGNTLVAIGAPFKDDEAREMIAKFPGFIQLQAALLDPALRLDLESTWADLARRDLDAVVAHNAWHDDGLQLTPYRWGAPPQAVLDAAKALRERLDHQADNDLPAFADKLLLVVGHADFTPDGYEMGDEGLTYRNAMDAGDGRVTLASARLRGLRTWQLQCEHGKLPSRESAFTAYVDLLTRGETDSPVLSALPALRDAAAAPVTYVPSRPSRAQGAVRPPTSAADAVRTEAPPAPAESGDEQRALSITVTNGDLSFVSEPLLLGHYSSLKLTGTERVMDTLIGGAMDASLRMGTYPDKPREHQVFLNTRAVLDNPWQPPRPRAVIVVGLGNENELRPGELAESVALGAVAWSQRAAELADAPAFIDIAATLIGSGGTGVLAGQSARLIAEGVTEANRRLALSGWPRIGTLMLVELYLDRASEAWQALQVLAEAEPARYKVDGPVRQGVGALRRPLDAGYRGAAYDYISVTSRQRTEEQTDILYTLDTRRARSEVREQKTQGGLLRDIIRKAASSAGANERIGRTLFNMLVPPQLEPFLAGANDMVLELDGGTADIPWELIDSGKRSSADSRPWAIRCKLLRRLRTQAYRAEPADARADDSVLIVGEPKCRWGRLPGARAEARAVLKRLAGVLPGDRLKALISEEGPDAFGADADTVVGALYERDWRIVHISGHGAPPEMAADGKAELLRGVVLSDDRYLGPFEIESMRTVPELVFVNCCHLAATTQDQLLRQTDHPRFAAGVARALIDLGVRCVVAAGWAVDDDAAEVFATSFYDALLDGRPFIEAVHGARTAAHACGGNTWAAYQCYGDPDWRLHAQVSDAQVPVRSVAREFELVGSAPALALALETIAVESVRAEPDPKRGDANAERQRARIRHLESRFAAAWGDIGAVAEAFAVAWRATDDTGRAIEWYRRALEANDGSASMKAAESYGNLLVRHATRPVDELNRRVEALCVRLEELAADDPAVAGLQSGRDAQAASLRQLAAAALPVVGQGRDITDRLIAVQSTPERQNLAGAAWKRLAFLHEILGDAERHDEALKRMHEHYERARAALSPASPEFFYPAENVIAARIALGNGGVDPGALVDLQANLAARNGQSPDFWSMAGAANVLMYEALAPGEPGRLEQAEPRLLQAFADLHARMSGTSEWASVYDQTRFIFGALQRRRALSGEDAAASRRLQLRLAQYAFPKDPRTP